jgi:AcrR family transcriptional regulator
MTEARRGRPRGFDPETALRQASDAFKTGGYAATSLDDIVRATGLNRPSLYAAFGDKKALYVAAIERLWEDISAQFDRLEARDLPLPEAVRTMLYASLDAYLAGERPRGCLAICTAATEAVNDDDIKATLAKVLDLMDDRIAGFYAKAGVNDAEAKARLVAGVMHSMSIRARAGATRDQLTAMADEAVRQFA